MPELPEVETVRRGLESDLTGKRILRLEVKRRDLRQPLPPQLEQALQGRRVMKLQRRAKYLLLELDDGAALLVHLGMSGSLVLRPENTFERRKHDHVLVYMEDESVLVFHDPRRFGLMDYIPSVASSGDHPLLAHLGLEPLEEMFSGEALYGWLSASSAPVKSVIMDQRKLVGVGNIYACEALFRARIHPMRPSRSITRKEAERLADAIRAVLTEAIASGGSTLRDYVRSSGDAGYFQHRFDVYGRAGKPCHACNAPVASLRQSGRSSFYCPLCQNEAGSGKARSKAG